MADNRDRQAIFNEMIELIQEMDTVDYGFSWGSQEAKDRESKKRFLVDREVKLNENLERLKNLMQELKNAR